MYKKYINSKVCLQEWRNIESACEDSRYHIVQIAEFNFSSCSMKDNFRNHKNAKDMLANSPTIDPNGITILIFIFICIAVGF